METVELKSVVQNSASAIMKILVAGQREDDFAGALDFLMNSHWSDGCLVRLLYVVEPSEVSDLWLSMSGATRYRFILAERQQHAEQTLQCILETFQRSLGEKFKFEVKLVVGRVSESVLQDSSDWNANLVVVGLPESTFIGRYVATATFSRVVSNAPCPVTFARSGSRKAG